MRIELKRLAEADRSGLIALMNDPRVRRYLPLATGIFDEAACVAFVIDKERIWSEHGYGPWALFTDGEFAGWGGLQPEGGDVELALVLHPDHWGQALPICRLILSRAFDLLRLPSVIMLLPDSRTRTRGIRRLGFQPDGETELSGHRFLRFRLMAQGSTG